MSAKIDSFIDVDKLVCFYRSLEMRILLFLFPLLQRPSMLDRLPQSCMLLSLVPSQVNLLFLCGIDITEWGLSLVKLESFLYGVLWVLNSTFHIPYAYLRVPYSRKILVLSIYIYIMLRKPFLLITNFALTTYQKIKQKSPGPVWVCCKFFEFLKMETRSKIGLIVCSISWAYCMQFFFFFNAWACQDCIGIDGYSK